MRKPLNTWKLGEWDFLWPATSRCHEVFTSSWQDLTHYKYLIHAHTHIHTYIHTHIHTSWHTHADTHTLSLSKTHTHMFRLYTHIMDANKKSPFKKNMQTHAHVRTRTNTHAHTHTYTRMHRRWGRGKLGELAGIIKAKSSGEDPKATGDLVSNLPHPWVNKTKQHTDSGKHAHTHNAKLIDNVSCESDVTSLKTPF